jgi:tetratricopeptide (TPR) repeat protein
MNMCTILNNVGDDNFSIRSMCVLLGFVLLVVFGGAGLSIAGDHDHDHGDTSVEFPELAAKIDSLLDVSNAPGRVRRVVFKVQVLHGRGESAKARNLLIEHLRNHPDQEHHLVHYHLGNLLALEDSLESGMTQLEAAVEMAPGLQPAWLNLGEVAYGLGAFDKAAVAFERAYKLDPRQTPELAYYWAVALLQADQAVDALPVLKSLIAKEAENPHKEWYQALISSALIINRPEAATTIMAKAVVQFPDDPEIWHLAYQQALAANDLELAAARLVIVGYLRSLTPSEMFQLGDLYMSIDVPQRAVSWYKMAIMQPDVAQDAKLSGYEKTINACLAAHDLGAALEAVEHRLTLDPTPDMWKMKGELLYAEGEFAAAYSSFRKAAELAPRDMQVELMSGYCCVELDRWETAKGHLILAAKDPICCGQANSVLAFLREMDYSPCE